jgi:hypothetical protein
MWMGIFHAWRIAILSAGIVPSRGKKSKKRTLSDQTRGPLTGRLHLGTAGGTISKRRDQIGVVGDNIPDLRRLPLKSAPPARPADYREPVPLNFGFGAKTLEL